MTDQPAVLFVCLGNICRSPLAEAAFRGAADRAGILATADSAGTAGWHQGRAPDPRAQAIARARGADISQLRARQVRAEDFRRFTHIVAMDHDNLSALRALRPDDARAALSRLLDHVPGRASDAVADPYYGDDDGFAETWADVSAGAEGLVRLLRARG